MSPLWGTSRRDRERLLVTLRSLGPTSTAGLSAALSWSERKTLKAIREITSRREAALQFDESDRSIGFAVPEGKRGTLAPAPVVDGSIPDGSRPDASPSPSAPLNAPSPSARPIGPGGNCDFCGVRMSPTGTGSTLYCPECGRLASSPSRRESTSRASNPPASSTLPSISRPVPPTVHHTPAPSDDRRAQEMFAAWVTAQPIQCPRCRTSLRHRGVGEYGCPACGERVMFGHPGVVAPTPRPPMAAVP